MDLSKELVIRREQPADYATVEQVVREAFWNVYTPACTEHYLLHIMRDHPAFVPELDMLALVGRRLPAVSFICARSFLHATESATRPLPWVPLPCCLNTSGRAWAGA